MIVANPEYGYIHKVPGGLSADAVHPSETVEQARAKLVGRNTREFALEKIFNPNDPLVLDLESVFDGLFSYTFAPWGYGYEDLVLFAAGPESLKSIDEEGHLPVDSVYKLPGYLQTAYWHRVLGLMVELEHDFPLSKFQVNQQDSPYIRGKNGKNPARTLHQIHAHISSSDDKWLMPAEEDWTFDHQKKERLFLSHHLPIATRQIAEELEPLLTEDQIRLSVDKNDPIYRLHFPFGRDGVYNPDNVKMLGQMMAAHAGAYHEATAGWNQLGSPQEQAEYMDDTWRMKLYFADDNNERNGNLVVAIAPGPYSGAGSKEVIDHVNLFRDKTMPPIFTGNSIKPIFNPIVKRTQANIIEGYRRSWPKNEALRLEIPASREHLVFPTS